MSFNRPMKIYVAGPYTPLTNDIHEAPREAYKNVQKAIRAGIEIIKRGHIPFIPHLTHFIHLETDEPLPRDFYYYYDMFWLQLCDALLFLGPSEGANKELNWAAEHGLTIYYSIDEIPICPESPLLSALRSTKNR